VRQTVHLKFNKITFDILYNYIILIEYICIYCLYIVILLFISIFLDQNDETSTTLDFGFCCPNICKWMYVTDLINFLD